MSTHAVIQFKDHEGIASIFKHSDGHPRWIGQYLKEALEFAWEPPRFEASDFAAAFVTACKLAHKQILEESEKRSKEHGYPSVHKTAGGEVYILQRSDDVAWQQFGDSRFRYLVECPKATIIVTAWEISEIGIPDVPGQDWEPVWYEARIYKGDLDGLMNVPDDPKRRLRPWKANSIKPSRRVPAPRIVHI